MKVAIIGSGISGLAVAHTLRGKASITLFEAADYFGGHAHTVDVTLLGSTGPVTHGVDTGFLVYNQRTYPELIRLFAELNVVTAASDMSFSVQVPGAAPGGGPLEWSGTSLSTVFAQRSNLFNLHFWGMLRDLLRFNALATRLAKDLSQEAGNPQLMQPLDDFLREHRFGQAFQDWYLLPMLGCIWSCPTHQMLQFPVATMVRFCHNHGLLQITDRPQWFTVAGGSRNYVEKITAAIADKRLNTPVKWVERAGDGVRIATESGVERFDKVVFATHSDQALALLQKPSMLESATLGAIRYQSNRAVLHTDTTVLPQNRSAWSAWNYERAPAQGHGGQSSQSGSGGDSAAGVCLHYLINQLQPLPFAQPVVVSLNPLRAIARNCVMAEYDYSHPVFDLAAIRAQADVAQLQGQMHTYYCGAWTGYGFHEDGLTSGLGVARQLLRQIAGSPGAPLKTSPGLAVNTAPDAPQGTASAAHFVSATLANFSAAAAVAVDATAAVAGSANAHAGRAAR